MYYRDVTTGATGATEVAPKYSDTLMGQILPTIAEVASKFSQRLHPWVGFVKNIFISVVNQKYGTLILSWIPFKSTENVANNKQLIFLFFVQEYVGTFINNIALPSNVLLDK